MPTTIPPADNDDNRDIKLAKRLRDLNAYEARLKLMDINRDGRLSQKEALAGHGDRLSTDIENDITQWLEILAAKPSPMPNPCTNQSCQPGPSASQVMHQTSAIAIRPTSVMMMNDKVFDAQWIADHNMSKSFGFKDALEAVHRAFPKGVDTLNVSDILSVSQVYLGIPQKDRVLILKRGGPTI